MGEGRNSMPHTDCRLSSGRCVREHRGKDPGKRLETK